MGTTMTDGNLMTAKSLEELGERLRARRIERNVALPNIAAETHIHQRFLDAIERGQFSLLPQTYIRSFLWSYASCVGLLPSELLESYDAIRNTPKVPSVPEGSTQYRPRRKWHIALRPVVVGALVVAAVGVAVFVFRTPPGETWPR